MSMIISASINVAKIDKSKIQTVDKNGKPFKDGAKYYNITISVNDDFDKFNNNVQITEAQTKEQREAKEKRVFIGNGRVNWVSNGAKSEPVSEKNTLAPKDESEELPF